MILILISNKNENYYLYFIKELPELSNPLLTTLANQNNKISRPNHNGPFKLCLSIS